MAKAHQSDFHSSIHKYRNVNVDNNEVLPSVYKSRLCTWRKQISMYRNKIRNSAYPAHVESLWILMALIIGFHFAEIRPPYGLMKYLTGYRIVANATLEWQVVICCLVAFIYWIIICRLMRYTLKLLLTHKGYMHESRGKGVSLKTKVWGMLMKAFIKWNPPSLYSFQESLPRLPVPKLDETIYRYLQSMQPLVNESEHKEIESKAEEFKNGIGKKLQRYLVLKSWSPSWTKSQSARAANIIHLAFQVRNKLEREEIKPRMAQGLVPLCSWQYERVFNTVREPGVETDRIVHFNDSKHVAIIYKGSFYKLIVYNCGRLLKPLELQHQIDQILNADAKLSDGEENLASLTAWDRTKWAQTRNKYFSSGINKESLHAIESAAFFMALDDEPFELSFDCPQEKLDNQARKLLHGNGNNRWFDKSVNVVVTSDAQFGINGEHSWADGPALGHIFEEIMIDDFLQTYDEFGNLKGSVSLIPPPPSPLRLAWDFSSDLIKTVDKAYNDALKMIDEVDHRIVLHKAFGKGFIKTCNVSPDAYIQMALQLANYREFGKFTLTYEASMTRLFREGRTETVRSCTVESSVWVKSMEDQNLSTAEKIRLLHNACRRHQTAYVDAMCGRGVDRHLFCLYVVSKYLKVDSSFLEQAISEPWRLSTSQTPHGQISKVDFKKIPGFLNPGAGFGPVTYDGYSVSYIVSGEDLISFHVSSNKSCPITNSSRFIDRIVQAMADIKTLFEDMNQNK